MKLNEQEFLLARARLHQYFEGQSASDGISIHPAQMDDATALLWERLYEEEVHNRLFIVCPESTNASVFNGFTKKVGLNFEVLQLSLFSKTDQKFFPAIWNVYVKWLHERVDENIIAELIECEDEKLGAK